MLWEVLASVAALIAGLAGWRAWRQAQEARAQRLTGPDAIDEAGFVRIGGIDQWVSVRGEDRANPPLILLHGGPGAGFLLIGYAGMRAWERDFTVVNWDQPGAGRTFGRNGRKGSGELSIDRMAADAVEVIEHALARTGQSKAIVLGASWGSILGVAVARRRPDLVAAYVGAGQVADMNENEAVGYASLMVRLQVRGQVRAAAKLEKIRPPPYASLDVLIRERRIMFANAPASEQGFVARVLAAAIVAPDARLKDVWDWLAAQQVSIRRLYKTLMAYSDRSTEMPVPLVFIQGEEDIQTPTRLACDYFDTLQAPSKAFVTIPGGGHNAVLAMPDAFHAALLEHVRPLARP